jgi:hypothetical protein
MTVRVHRGEVFDERLNGSGAGTFPVIECDLCGQEIRREGNVIYGKSPRRGRMRLFKRLTFTHKHCYAQCIWPQEVASGDRFVVGELSYFLESLLRNFSRPPAETEAQIRQAFP